MSNIMAMEDPETQIELVVSFIREQLTEAYKKGRTTRFNLSRGMRRSTDPVLKFDRHEPSGGIVYHLEIEPDTAPVGWVNE